MALWNTKRQLIFSSYATELHAVVKESDAVHQKQLNILNIPINDLRNPANDRIQ